RELIASDVVPLQLAANSVVRCVHHYLKNFPSRASRWPSLHLTPYRSGTQLLQLVVSVGPTIGLGDEFILARSLLERAADVGAQIHVETRRFDLWNCLQGPVMPLGPPPFAGPRFINAMPPDVAARTGYIFADFLGSDPSELPV